MGVAMSPQGIRTFAGNDDTDAGNFMEEGIGKFTLHKLKIDASETEEPGTILHPDYPNVFAVTPDLVVPGQKMGIQIKNHMQWAYKRYKGAPGSAGRWDNTLVPTEKLMQCLLEQEVVSKVYAPGDESWKMWFLSSYFGGSTLRNYQIRRNSETVRGLLAAGIRFWIRHLDPKGPVTPPAPDCTCGGCGQGSKWWIGPYRVEKKPTPLQPDMFSGFKWAGKKNES
jgi:hypothetical protein